MENGNQKNRFFKLLKHVFEWQELGDEWNKTSQFETATCSNAEDLHPVAPWMRTAKATLNSQSMERPTARNLRRVGCT